MSTEEKETPAADPAPEAAAPLGPPKSTFREYFESFVITLIMAIFGMTFILQAVTVPTGSMQNTILVGDYLLVNKFIFTPGGHELPFLPQRDIQRGDVIVFKYPGNAVNPDLDRQHGASAVKYQVNYVKRVIGLPGETVEFKNDHVYINGELLPEHRMIGNILSNEAPLETREFEPTPPGAKWTVYYDERVSLRASEAGRLQPTENMEFALAGKPITVPPNSFFVMGDSRDNSEDSRFWGFVPRGLVIGRAMFVYWSCDRTSSDKGLACVTNPRISRIGTLIK